MRLYVDLTETTNPYLRPFLPLRGILDIHETGLDGSIMAATFAADGETTLGFPSPFVRVENVGFVVSAGPVAAQCRAARYAKDVERRA